MPPGIGYSLGEYLRRQGPLIGGAVSGLGSAVPSAEDQSLGAPSPSLFNDFRAGLQGAPAYGQDVELRMPAQAIPAAQPSLLPPSEPMQIERAINRPAPVNMASLQAGAFQGRPGFNSSVGGAAPTANQLAADTNARALLEAKYAMENEATEAEAGRRGDPMAQSIEGMEKSRAYESLLPYGSRSRIGASFGSGWGDLSGSEVGSEVTGERTLGGPTIGMARDQELAHQQSLIKNAPAFSELELRVSLAQKLAKLREVADQFKKEGQDPAKVDTWYGEQERALLQGLTAVANKDLGFFRQ